MKEPKFRESFKERIEFNSAFLEGVGKFFDRMGDDSAANGIKEVVKSIDFMISIIEFQEQRIEKLKGE